MLSTPHPDPSRTVDAPLDPVVEARGVSVVLGGRPVLRGVDLEIRSGEFVALMGANGSGKSTLVRALTGLRPVVKGEVRLFGTPLDRFAARHRIGFVPQRSGAGGGVPASVWEIVASGRLTRRRWLRPFGAADRAAVRAALDVVGLADRVRDGVSTLSGGQQQRVLIARALAGEPELLFLDEPTAGVDLPNQVALAEALQVLKGRGATVILVAHELGPLAPLVDRAVVMRDGRVAYDGPPLADDEVHAPLFGEPHAHHHHGQEGGAAGSHSPRVASPFDAEEGR